MAFDGFNLFIYISDHMDRRHDDTPVTGSCRGHDISHLSQTQIQPYCQMLFIGHRRSARL
eukprot:scaffold14482_cov83-Skeletonema_dohrnii-CCMP3373.AAC.1